VRPSDRDTIVAIATAPGEGAIGIIRLSGPEAIRVAGSCFEGKQALEKLSDRSLTYGRAVTKDQFLDEVLVSVMRGPRSYTGEDTVEFNCHGGPLILRRISSALIDSGARSAEAGEFTRRAFLNGKMDLTQAEAVAEMIGARADLGLESAYFKLRGGLRKRFEGMAEALRVAISMLEADLDFSEDVKIDSQVIAGPLENAARELEDLVGSYAQGKVLRDGAVVTLAGKPNAGKSSLLNRLLEEERAIVTATPGTTRDTIEETVDLNGAPVILVDTAGLRKAGDPVEQEGARRTKTSIERSELVLHVVDASVDPSGEDLELLEGFDERKLLLVKNKEDLGEHPGWSSIGKSAQISVSALTGSHINDLRNAIREAVLGKWEGNPGIITQERHVEALVRARASLSRAQDALGTGLPGEVVAFELRETLAFLASIVGETTSDDVLDRIFKTFCIGK
jgi:tRNA modification GTPase